MDNVKHHVAEMLDFFIENLSQPMPTLPKIGFTKLDRLTRDQRNEEWKRISNGCESLRSDLIKVTTSEQLDQLVDDIEDYINQVKNMAYEVCNTSLSVLAW